MKRSVTRALACLVGFLLSFLCLVQAMDGIYWGMAESRHDRMIQGFLIAVFGLGVIAGVLVLAGRFWLTIRKLVNGLILGMCSGILIVLNLTFDLMGVLVLSLFFAVVGLAGIGAGLLLGLPMACVVERKRRRAASRWGDLPENHT